jgi:hypothetical protein
MSDNRGPLAKAGCGILQLTTDTGAVCLSPHAAAQQTTATTAIPFRPPTRPHCRAAAALDVEKRDVYLQRIATALTLVGRFNDADLATAIDQALTGLLQEPAA